MKKLNRRQHDAQIRIRDLCASRADVFRDNLVAQRMIGQLDASTDRAKAAFAAHEAGLSAEDRATGERADARAALRGGLKAIARTSPVVAIEAGTDARFVMPRNCSDKQLIAVATDFVERATPLSEKFAAHKLPSNVVANLPAQIAVLERAIAGADDARRAHTVARQVAAAALGSGAAAMDALERIYMNAVGGDTEAVASWKHQRRVGPSQAAVAPADAPAQTPPTTKVA